MDSTVYSEDYRSDVEEISEIAHKFNSSASYYSIVGDKFDNGFTIDPKMALTIIRTYAPEKEEIYSDCFTIDTIRKETMLIAKLNDGTVVYTVPLPKEIKECTVSMDFEKTLEMMRDTTEQYKKIQVLGCVGLFIAVMVAVGIYGLAYYLTFM